MTPFDAPAFPEAPVFDVGASAARAVPTSVPAPLADPLGRVVRYLRLSVTDRCDLRCVYCMPERMTFLPRREVLTLEELERVAAVFIGLGARKLRLTGGEPLVRKDVLTLFERLGARLGTGGLDELTLTTNGTRLSEFAPALHAAGVRRVNVSLDTLDADTYRRLTRGGDLAVVLRGIEAAQAAGLAVKVNAVALAQDNRAELSAMVAWAHGRGLDLTFIEAMPMGDLGSDLGGDTGADRSDQHLSLQAVRDELAAIWTLTPIVNDTGGPARWLRVEETGGRLGLITPLSHTFCDTCNRLRVTATGVLHTCLGQDDATDLRTPLRDGASDAELAELVRRAVAAKPRGHDFRIGRGERPAVARHMSVTGG